MFEKAQLKGKQKRGRGLTRRWRIINIYVHLNKVGAVQRCSKCMVELLFHEEIIDVIAWP
jgi:hypothetical protein